MIVTDKPTILLVDDNEANLKFLELLIEPFDINVIRALSGKEALTRIKGRELALALIDINMPKMTGIELASIIQIDRSRDLVPIIFITAFYQDELQLEECYNAGAVDFIQKPFNKNILESKIKVFLELFRNKQQIYESENMYRTLLDASPEGIVIIDINGKIKEASNIAVEILGNKIKENLIGKVFLQFIPETEIPKIKELITRVREEGLVQSTELILNTGDKSQIISEISITQVNDLHGLPKSLMAIIRDVSHRKRMEKQLNYSERMSVLGELASGIAHEINQPLNTISLSLENIIMEIGKKTNLDETYFRNKSKKIFEGIFRIGKIIDHVREFSKERNDFIHSTFNVNDSISNAVSMISEQFRHKGIDLVIELDNSIDSVQGNTYKFEQVIINLLVNAKDAIEEKVKSITDVSQKEIKIISKQVNERIKIEIHDNGTGIKPEEVSKIMNPFFTTKDPGKGTGLGLSISYGIIKEMNGTFDVKSELTVGSVFVIELPVKPVIKKKK